MTDQSTQTKVIELYSLGFSSRKVANEVGISSTQVRRILKQNNVLPHSTTIHKDKTDSILEMYNKGGKSSEHIAKALDIHPSTVCRVLKRHGIEIKSASYFNRKHLIYLDAFKNITTESQAYFLGLMYSDGNVSSSKPSFSITLHNKDIDTLKKFSEFIFGCENIDYGKKYSTLRVNSSQIRKDLIKLGCVPAKTFKLQLSDDIKNSKLFRHFVRGFFDGDGCITIDPESKRVRVVFTGYDKFLISMNSAFANLCGVKFYEVNVKENVLDLVIGDQKNTRKFLHWLYDDATLYMDRKIKKSQEALTILDDKAVKNLQSNTILTFKKQKLTSKNILAMSKDEREEAAQFVFDEFRTRGFPYDKYTQEELTQDFLNLINRKATMVTEDNRFYNTSMGGLKIFRHFCDNYYDVSGGKLPSMHQAFEDDAMLIKAIKNRMGFFFENEAFNITGRMLRQGFRNGRIAFAASVFKPSIAKFFYEKFEAKKILDISAGFGQRMIAASAVKAEKYVATDPWDSTFKSLTRMQKFLEPLSSTTLELINTGSENLNFHNEFDFCFSSPPFFNKEIYSRDQSQAYSQGFGGFMKYWNKTLHNVHSALMDNKYFVLNMDSSLANHLLDTSLFSLEETYYIEFQRGHLGKNSRDNYYVLRKV